MTLSEKIGNTFIKNRHGVVENVQLLEVRRDRVKIKNLKNQNETTLPIAKFEKFYQSV